MNISTLTSMQVQYARSYVRTKCPKKSLYLFDLNFEILYKNSSCNQKSTTIQQFNSTQGNAIVQMFQKTIKVNFLSTWS